MLLPQCNMKRALDKFWMVISMPRWWNLMQWWYVDRTTFIESIQGQKRRMLNGRLRSTTWHTISWFVGPALVENKIVPSLVLSKLSYALIVITLFIISTLVYPSFLMNINVKRFKDYSLSIMTLLTENSKTITMIPSEKMWFGSISRTSKGLKDNTHEVDRYPTRFWNSIALISARIQDSWSTF